MSNLTLTGILKVKKSESIVNDKFKKLEFVVTDTASQYPQHVSLQLTQDRTSLLDNVNEGDKITVSFNLRGREWTSPVEGIHGNWHGDIPEVHRWAYDYSIH